MPRFAANVSFLFQEHPLERRFAAAARAGFGGVEVLFPYDTPPEALAALARQAGVALLQFNLPPGDWAAGERGLAALPGREAEFERSVEIGLDYARRSGVRQVHVMAGCSAPGAAEARLETYCRNLGHAARRFAPDGVTVQIEPINPRDIPGYFLTRGAVALDVLQRVGAENLKIQLDLYHRQIVEGDLTRFLTEHIARISHIQIAGVPERGEPDRGEVNYPAIFALLDALGYAGWVGCEYRPQGDTEAGLGWMHGRDAAAAGEGSGG